MSLRPKMSEFNYQELVQNLRKAFRGGAMKTLEARIEQLKQLNVMLEKHEEELYDAVYKDLRKCRTEANLTELLQVRIELGNAVKNLSSWMKPKRVAGDLLNKLNTCEIRYDPLGVVLLISPWNYPLSMVLVPLIGALAGGNCVVVKPSELASHTSALLAKLIPEYLSPDVVQVVEGGVPATTALFLERFDLIFFTGSIPVGKLVMQAAAEHLSPVVLELGGKSPAIVDETCTMDIVAQRLAWGKFSNCGQTCIAPDYIICVGDIVTGFVDAMKNALIKFYGEDAQDSDSYGRIINERHFERLCRLIDASKVVYGNDTDKEDLYISPTLLTNVTGDDLVMKEEIFGPVLPILQMDSVDDAIQFINNREKPLALYVFSTDSDVTERVTDQTSSGGVLINDTISHAGVPSLPFGGVGQSEMGRYHGKFSFETFSHTKAYMYKSQRLETVNQAKYPPYKPDSYMLRVGEWVLKPNV